LKLPVLSALRPYTGGVSFNKAFQQGDVRATLSRGVVRVQELTLVSDLAQIYVDGTVTLAGRLNLQAIVNTGSLEGAGIAAERLVQALAISLAPPQHS
jgi:translocation and assembly module TamB